jgi:hypothetical protein
MSSKDLETDEVAEIYDELLKTYETEWAYRGHRSLHLAYYDDDHDDPAAASVNTIRVLAEAAGIDGDDTVQLLVPPLSHPFTRFDYVFTRVWNG